MAAQTYTIATPDGNTETVSKSGKAPTFATWAFFTTPHWKTGETGWLRAGWSFRPTAEEAQRKALPDARKMGLRVTVTPVL